MPEWQWTSTKQVIPIRPDSLHIWQLSLNLEDQDHHLWSLLSADEQQRAKRFVRLQDQAKFVQVRGSLRALLGQYLERPGGELCFDYGEYGKPQLVAACNPINLEFNVSHSQKVALIAVTQAVAVGIDVERVNTRVNYQHLSRRFFADVEHQALLRQSVEKQRHVFFQLWTRKEACIKAMGGSIAHSLDQVLVSQDLEQPMVAITVQRQPKPCQLFLYTLALDPNYVGAVAMTQPLQHIRTWRWDNNPLN